jgi:hypothetical protein
MAMEQPMRPADVRPVAAPVEDLRVKARIRILVNVVAIALAIAMVATMLPAEASGPRKAHPPMFECTSSGSLRVTCRGSFADGTSAAGIVVRVLDKADHVVYAGTVDKLGRVSFRKPDAQFSVVFDAGEGNVLTLLGSEMT